MVEHAAFARVFLPRDVDARLLVKPPRGEPEFLRDAPGLLQDDAMRNEQGVDVTGHAGGVIGERHGCPADDEHVGDYAPAHQAIPQGSERSFELFSVEQDAPWVGHAASRSAAARYTPCWFVSGPGAIASALRRSLLGKPLNTKSAILDIGYADTIPYTRATSPDGKTILRSH